MSYLLNSKELYLKSITEEFAEIEQVKKDLPKLVQIIPRLGNILFEIIYNYDSHYDGDIEIEDLKEFEKQSIDKIKNIIKGGF